MSVTRLAPNIRNSDLQRKSELLQKPFLKSETVCLSPQKRRSSYSRTSWFEPLNVKELCSINSDIFNLVGKERSITEVLVTTQLCLLRRLSPTHQLSASTTESHCQTEPKHWTSVTHVYIFNLKGKINLHTYIKTTDGQPAINSPPRHTSGCIHNMSGLVAHDTESVLSD